MSNYTSGVFNRRTRALSRLKEQLRNNEECRKVEDDFLLTEKNITRINAEIKVLQERI